MQQAFQRLEHQHQAGANTCFTQPKMWYWCHISEVNFCIMQGRPLMHVLHTGNIQQNPSGPCKLFCRMEIYGVQENLIFPEVPPNSNQSIWELLLRKTPCQNKLHPNLVWERFIRLTQGKYINRIYTWKSLHPNVWCREREYYI